LFERSYSKLTEPQQDLIDAAITDLMTHPYYPFPKKLKVHKLEGVKGTPPKKGGKAPDVWEMHASGPLLVTFQYGNDEVIFRNCGEHEAVLRTP